MTPVLRCLQAALDADRSAFRRSRVRLIEAEADMIAAMRDWQNEPISGGRSHYRYAALENVRRVRNARARLKIIDRMLAVSSEAYQAASSEWRATLGKPK